MRHRIPALTKLFVAALLAASCSGQAAPIRNVLLISIDTLRADHLGAYGHERPTSPNLDRLARAGVLFEDATTTSPWTLPAHVSLLTGLYPDGHGVRTNKHFLGRGIPTLAQLLADEGFETGAVVNGYFVGARFGLARGFDSYEMFEEDQSRTGAARDVTGAGIRWLRDRRDRRNFLFLHYFDVHSSYQSAAKYERMFIEKPNRLTGDIIELMMVNHGDFEPTDEDLDHFARLYDAGIRQLDDALARLFEFLDANGWLEDTLVIVTSDHGEEFLEHGKMVHGHSHYQELMHVPLIMRGPGLPAGTRVELPVSLIDVAPTVLSLVGIRTPADMTGVDLRSTWSSPEESPAERLIFAETGPMQEDALRSVRSGRFKLILDVRDERYELYDLNEDPSELHDLAAERPERFQWLRAELSRFTEESRLSKTLENTEEDIKHLEALGYL